MPTSFDPFMPKTRFQFRDAGTLSVGTVSCEDQIHQAVYLSYTPEGSNTPTMELELPPKTVQVIIEHLQERANEARFVNGEKMLEYPKPVPMKPSGAKPARRRKNAVKQASNQSPPRDAPPSPP
jgi:hypothetical protein